MTLPELSIKRHVLAYMLSGALVLFGIISYQRLGILSIGVGRYKFNPQKSFSQLKYLAASENLTTTHKKLDAKLLAQPGVSKS